MKQPWPASCAWLTRRSSSKSATQLLADRAAGWLFYIALAVAAMTAIVWTMVDGFNWQVVERVVTVLVIACPHALGLAVPLVVAISTSLAARNGILVRNRLALEEARLLNTIVFDKTGTLDHGGANRGGERRGRRRVRRRCAGIGGCG
jgi:Cu2+-exporting ATPase